MSSNLKTIFGTKDDEFILGTKADEFIFGTKGDDFILPRLGFDAVFGRAGNDYIAETVDERRNTKYSHDDVFHGGAGNDTLVTAHGHDILNGGKGNDNFICNSQDTFVVRGGQGYDVLHLPELSHFTETRAHGMTILTNDSDFSHQVIYVTGVEDIRYDAGFPM